MPSRTLGRIIGSNGNRIWNIGQDTGCKVEVEGHQTRIHLMGSPDRIETAHKIIEEKVKESDLRDITFGKIGAFNIFAASVEQDTKLENIAGCLPGGSQEDS